ncbi:uncharacterized protein RCO7_05967 [Rhynchosporium graminicola]|uniref:Uncharacterized protein n=2 Tax=Rhynchosporium TaxID=38037 RepID=A0A1E1MDQ6_RHYSE|nr:uncharacterized protein RCO7_05967 [Rhynchosporium commune]CZT47187.1 uncharacterized protein RSE6_16082 [Rhynchosporium secalis]
MKEYFVGNTSPNGRHRPTTPWGGGAI